MLTRTIKNLAKRFSPIWVFGSFKRESFFHNSKAFFLYCHKRKLVKPIWISMNSELVKELRSEGFFAFHAESSVAKILCLIAKYHITDWGINDINSQYFKNSFHVNLWHGIALKTNGLDVKTDYKTSIDAFGKPDIIVAASDFDRNNLATAFNLNRSSIYVTGLPRNDWLSNKLNPTRKDLNFISYIEELRKNRKLILYLPTFDDSQDINSFAWINQDFDDFLQSNNFLLLTKKHVADNSSQLKDQFNNIILLETDCDLYPAMNLFDLMITDYSSVLFDFALTGNRIIHFIPNHDLYSLNIRNLYFDIMSEDNSAGDVCINTDELKKSILSGSNKSKQIAIKYNTYDNKFSKRVFKLLKSFK